jgi:hypothetical protein
MHDIISEDISYGDFILYFRDITYKSELIPPFWAGKQVKLSCQKGGINSHKQGSDTTENDLRRYHFRKSCAH